MRTAIGPTDERVISDIHRTSPGHVNVTRAVIHSITPDYIILIERIEITYDSFDFI